MMSVLPGRVVAALVFAAALTLGYLTPAGQRLERDAGLGALYAVRGAVEVPPEAIIVALDQSSTDWLAFHAEAPERVSDILPACLPATTKAALPRLRSIADMPRGIHACLLRVLEARGARLVAFDILFSIPTADDAALAEAIASGPPVILFERIRGPVEQGAGSGELAPPQRVHPRPIFTTAAAATASFLVSAPSANFVEGYVRRTPDFPDLAAMPEVAAALFRGQPPPLPPETGPEISPIWLYGPPRTIPTWNLRDVFERESAKPLPDDLADRAVFVGVSDPEFLGTKDHFKIPISDAQENDIGGVELAASAFLNLLHGDGLDRPPAAVSAIIVFGVGLALALASQVVGGWRGIMLSGALAAGYAGATIAAFLGPHLWLPLAVPIFAGLPVVTFWALISRYALARRLVGTLAPRPVATHLLDRRDGARDIRTEAATVLFTDIVGSTQLGDTMAHDSYSRVINHYYERATEAVEAQRGMVVEFMGDGIIAVFTESVTGADHARRGCAAAIALSDAIRVSERELADDGVAAASLRLRMGIHTGTTSTGGMGAEHRFNFKVLGDTVNTAARLEQLGKAFDDGQRDVMLLSNETREASGMPDSAFETLGEFTLRGKREPILVSRLQHRSTIPHPSR